MKFPHTLTHSHTHTYDVQREVAVAAHVSRRVLGAAVVQAVVVWTGAFDRERPLLVVDLMAPLTQLRAILEPLARGSASKNKRQRAKKKNCREPCREPRDGQRGGGTHRGCPSM